MAASYLLLIKYKGRLKIYVSHKFFFFLLFLLLKQLLTIFFLALLIAALYSRQLAFLHCRIAVAIKSATLKCDCENSDENAKKMQAAPLPAKNFHYIPDDLYCCITVQPMALHAIFIKRSWKPQPALSPSDVTVSIFRPPCC